MAIKRMKKESKQGMREFINEVRLLGRLRHTNLVQLVGFCATEEEQLLCYEYMSNGNLAQHLRGGPLGDFCFAFSFLGLPSRRLNGCKPVGFRATEKEVLLRYGYMPIWNLAQHLRGGLPESLPRTFPLLFLLGTSKKLEQAQDWSGFVRYG